MGKPKTLSVFGRKKRRGEKIVVLTAYDLTSALIANEGGVDAILVGDSVGMVVLGHENTLPVTIADMVHHCRAVQRARPSVPVIADMPYGSFHISPQKTVEHAVRLVKEAGVAAVKIEGGRKRQAVIEALLAAEIPVMGHLGLTPQSLNKFGGYKVQGRGHGAADVILDEAQFLAAAGCFSMVLECIPAELAGRISEAIDIPTIGIGAGPECDGQVLVYHDLLGLFQGLKPKFVKRYVELGELATGAVRAFCDDVRNKKFPGPEHCYEDLQQSQVPKTETPDKPADSQDDPAGPPKGYLASIENPEV